MAMKDYGIAFMLAGNLTASFKNAFSEAGKAMGNCAVKATESNRKAINIQGILKQREAIEKLETEYKKFAGVISKESITVKSALDKANMKLAESYTNSGVSPSTPTAVLKAQQASAQRMASGYKKADSGKARMMENSGYAMAISSYAQAAISDVVQVGQAFEAQMSRVGAIARADADDMAKLNAEAKRLGESTEWSAS